MLKVFLARARNAAVWAALGAGIGGSLAAMWSIWLITENLIDAPFLSDSLMVFSISGAVAGAVLSFILGVLVRDKRALIAIGSGVFGGLGTGVLIPFAIFFFASSSWPSPSPYPGASVTTNETLGASGWHYRTRTYIITSSVNDLRQYYDEQMSLYCLGEWQFEDSTGPEYANCLEASCDIQMGADPQYFFVYLCPIDETQIRVIQKDMWEFD